jgi:parallel beta-helix repeat protein
MKQYLISTLVLVLATLFVVLPAQSETIIVGQENADYGSIQEAVYAASPGDTIEVHGGNYSENVYVDKKLVLRGISDGRNIPVITAIGNGSAVTLMEDGIVLEGFLVTNAVNASGVEVYSNGNIIAGNRAYGNKFGVYIYDSSFNEIRDNDLSYNAYVGIELDNSKGNLVTNNTVKNNSFEYDSPCALPCKRMGFGIEIQNSNDNLVANNTVINNLLDAIDLYSSNNNTVKGNHVSNNEVGIYLYDTTDTWMVSNLVENNTESGIFIEESNDNLIADNLVKNNPLTGLNLWRSLNNTLKNNTMSGNKYSFDADGKNDIDKSNLINGRPIYYLVGKSNLIIDESSMAGTVYCINCSNVSVKNLVIKNNDVGIYFFNTNNSRVENNTLSDNEGGVMLQRSSNNAIIGNTASNSLENGIIIAYSSDENTVLNNKAIYNMKSGIFIESSWENKITENFASHNLMNGIVISNSSMNTVSSNIGSNNSIYGLWVIGSSEDNVVSQNRISGKEDSPFTDIW